MPAAMESSQNIENPLEISIFSLNFFEMFFFGKSPHGAIFLIKETKGVQSWNSKNPSDSRDSLQTFVSKCENEGGRKHIELCGVYALKNFQGSATLVGELRWVPLCRYNIYRQWDFRLFPGFSRSAPTRARNVSKIRVRARNRTHPRANNGCK